MNYLKELNAFYNKVTFEPLSGSAIALWNTLMHFNNRCGWRREFSVAASVLKSTSGVKGGSFSRAREELKMSGFIRVTSRGANQAAMYQMISQIEDFVGDKKEEADMQTKDVHGDNCIPIAKGKQTDHKLLDEQAVKRKDESADNREDGDKDDRVVSSMDDSPVPLVRQKEYNIQNRTNHDHHTVNHFDVFSFYQENFGFAGAYVQEKMQYWIQEKGEELVLYAMKRALEQNKATWGYVKGILKMWSQRKVTSVQQAEAENMSFRHKNQNSVEKFHKVRREVVPEWFDKRKQEEQQQERESPVQETVETEEEKAEFDRLLKVFTGG